MSDDVIPGAQPIPQAGEPEWAPGLEDDAEQRAPGEIRRGPRWIFIGKEGLRAGWSIALFLLIATVLGAAVTFIVRRLIHPGAAAPAVLLPSRVILGEGSSFLLLLLAAWIVHRIERRPFSSYGIGRFRPVQFLVGSLWGAGLLALLVTVLHWRGLLVFTGQAEFGAAALKWGILWLIGFLMVGFVEEFLTRGFLQFTLARGVAGIAEAAGMGDRSRRVLGFWLAALFFSFIFGLGHRSNAGESPIGLLSAGLIGLVFTFSLWRTGSLWWAIGFHMAWDWMQSFTFGVADSGTMAQHRLWNSQPQGAALWSGGLTGPEGSIFVLAIIVLAAVVIALTLPSEPGSPSAG